MANAYQKWKRRAPHINERIAVGVTPTQLADEYDCSPKTIQNRVREMESDKLISVPKGWYQWNAQESASEPTPQPERNVEQAIERAIEEYGKKIEITADGSHKSDILLRISAEQVKQPKYLLEAHGYDPAAWELVTARSNIWNVYSTADGIQTLYASKITVKPKVQAWIYDDLIRVVNNVPAIHIPDGFATTSTVRMLEIPLYDTHFGVSDIEHYQSTLSDTLDRIHKKKWEQIEITIGQDLLHNDNFRGTTASGTPIEAVNIPNAWGDALKLYAPIIAASKKQAQSVKIIYSKGNHDESMSWAFVQNLRSLFPWAIYDHEVEERKVHMFHRCFIGITHGDKTPPKELVTLFATEFPQEWAQAVTREIHKGHWHKEDANDDYGSMVRTLATRNKTDEWHKNRGFTKAHKRFQLFEWDHTELKHIHYV